MMTYEEKIAGIVTNIMFVICSLFLTIAIKTGNPITIFFAAYFGLHAFDCIVNNNR